ncbi:flagellin [Hydrogenophaga sp.]|uniref:flagellin n=1 Tax=Hydrogenophaga sp. TaxID=1904254 RepID=UPI0027316B7C|nr:flagellin [Hydrogenophaga sp.]MDP1686272.1 flagellin [Hydrogenophaga sp.]
MTTINTNVMSMNAQRNLTSSQGALATSMQRLSSGLRVNSAKDDAAGLAISERMNAQVRGMTVAARNANDGISLAQTAEGALGKVGDMLQRVRELAVQSANGTNSVSDRESLQAEAKQLKDEIDRVADQTSFNGTKLLQGGFTSVAFQVGANQGETISIDSISDTNIAALGSWTSVATPAVASTATQTAAYVAGSSTTVTDALQISIDGTVAADRTSPNATAANMQTDLATFVSNSGGAYSMTGTLAGGDLVVTKADGTAVAITTSSSDGVGSTATAAGTVSAQTLTTTSVLGTAAVAGTAQTGFAALDISTVEGANNAIVAMDAALTAVNASRGKLGAVQSRFENAIANINVTSENLSAARGRIVDTDFAKETANLSRAQILQQAGTAMVAQANQAPQGVLSLLR